MSSVGLTGPETQKMKVNLKEGEMKGCRLTVSVIAILGIVYFPKAGWTDSTVVEKRLNKLEREVAILKLEKEVIALKRQSKKEDKDNKAPETPIVSASVKDGFSIKNPDDSFKLKIRGLVQADGRF